MLNLRRKRAITEYIRRKTECRCDESKERQVPNYYEKDSSGKRISEINENWDAYQYASRFFALI